MSEQHNRDRNKEAMANILSFPNTIRNTAKQNNGISVLTADLLATHLEGLFNEAGIIR